MKKTLLLSVVASTMIMAGGDIAPVEPMVIPAPVEVSAWNFSGNAVAYYQTNEVSTAVAGKNTLGSSETSWNDFAVQLRATNSDIFWGIGAGVELTGHTSLADVSIRGVQNGASGASSDAGFTQAYLTYGIDAIDTSIKVGRQTLPKSLSPFAFTEGWQPIKNTFDAALVVNSSIPDTTLVYAAVTNSNSSVGSFNQFGNINGNGDVVHMVTAQNKSISGLTLTGTFYNAPKFDNTNALNVMWADAKFNMGGYGIAVQGGQVLGSKLTGATKDTTAYGAKISGNWGMFDVMAAYSSVDDGTVSIHNLGTGVKTPLYTQSILDQNSIKRDANAYKVAMGMKALGGKFGVAYIGSSMGTTALASTFIGGAGKGNYAELDVTYKSKITENTTLFAAYVYQNDDRLVSPSADTNNFVRVWARYNFN